jgi:hypothetical protein
MYAAAGFGEQASEDMQQKRRGLMSDIDRNPVLGAAGLHHHVQKCVALLQAPQSEAAAAAAAVQAAALAADSASSDGVLLCGLTGHEVPAAERSARLALAVVRVQHYLLRVAQESIWNNQIDPRRAAAPGKAKQLAEAGLQLLWAHKHVLHDLSKQQAPQLHASAGQVAAMRVSDSHATSSSSSSSRRPVRFQLLPIPSVHERLKFVPGAAQQLYLQALLALLEQGHLRGLYGGFATAAEVLSGSLFDENARLLAQEARAIAAAAAARGSGRAGDAAKQEDPTDKLFTQLESDAQELTAPAVLLVLELLQLLAARSETGELGVFKIEPLMAFEQCCALLMKQLGMLAACRSAGCAVRRAVVLRQSGQQLLQLLRWRLQNIASQQACSSSSSSSAEEATEAADLKRVELGSTLQLLMWAAGAWNPLSGNEGESCC